MLKLFSISFSFSGGGAAIAADKFTQLFTRLYPDALVDKVDQSQAGMLHFVKRVLSYMLGRLQWDGNPSKHSLNLFTFKPVLSVFQLDQNALHHIHWINNDTLSIFDFDKIPSGSIITLHDEWLYCGAEHCTRMDDNTQEFIHGYQVWSKGVYGVPWNWMIWQLKKKKLSHRSDLIVTAPSQWLVARARSSLVLQSSAVRYLPNPINTEIFSPASASTVLEFRNQYNLQPTDIVLAFGAFGGLNKILKGAALLDEAFALLAKTLPDECRDRIKLINFGGNIKAVRSWHGFNSISVGHISNPSELAILYSAVDCMIVPSQIESFGQVAAEAGACETPVVCFNTSGMTDVVVDGITGLYADCFKADSLAHAIKEVIVMPETGRRQMGRKARQHINVCFSYPAVEVIYAAVIEEAMSLKNAYGH